MCKFYFEYIFLVHRLNRTCSCNMGFVQKVFPVRALSDFANLKNTLVLTDAGLIYSLKVVRLLLSFLLTSSFPFCSTPFHNLSFSSIKDLPHVIKSSAGDGIMCVLVCLLEGKCCFQLFGPFAREKEGNNWAKRDVMLHWLDMSDKDEVRLSPCILVEQKNIEKVTWKKKILCATRCSKDYQNIHFPSNVQTA